MVIYVICIDKPYVFRIGWLPVHHDWNRHMKPSTAQSLFATIGYGVLLTGVFIAWVGQ